MQNPCVDFYQKEYWKDVLANLLTNKLTPSELVQRADYPAMLFPVSADAEAFLASAQLSKELYILLITVLEKMGFSCTNAHKGCFSTAAANTQVFWQVPLLPNAVLPAEYQLLLRIFESFACTGFLGYAVQLANCVLYRFWARGIHSSHVQGFVLKSFLPLVRLLVATHGRYHAESKSLVAVHTNPVLAQLPLEVPADLNDPGITQGKRFYGKEQDGERVVCEQSVPCCGHGLLAGSETHDTGTKFWNCLLHEQDNCGFHQEMTQP